MFNQIDYILCYVLYCTAHLYDEQALLASNNHECGSLHATK